MTDILHSPYARWAFGAVLLLLLWLWYRYVRGRGGKLEQILNEIGYERVNNIVIPNGDDGEILIDQLILTSQGLLVLEVKDVDGVVFGSDKMQDWTVISADRRYTFSNPQHGLYDRIAAVRQIVRQVPVAGRIVFLDKAEFTKGKPGLVATLDQLAEEFGEKNKKAAQVKIEAFMPHWELIRKRAGK
ncbi:MAG: nuclease-related domain-containing protein [Woeseiaceae bacterium]